MASCLIENVPQRLLDHVIFHFWANLSRSVKLLVVITEDHHLYEIHNKEILASSPLHTSGKGLNGSSIINETWADLMDINDQEGKGGLKFRVLFSYDSATERKVHYLILINESLLVVQRKNLLKRSELILSTQRCDHVIDYKVVDAASTGHPTVSVYKLDGSVININFSNIDEPISRQTAPGELSDRSAVLAHQLQTQKALHQKILEDIGDKVRFGLSVDDEAPRECLVRYGDAWKRIHNDQVVIGVPVLNASTRMRVFLVWVTCSRDMNQRLRNYGA